MLRGGANLSASHDVEVIKVVDAKTQRGIEAKSVTENTKSILTPMAGEEAIVHERLASVTSAGAGELAARVVKDDRTISREDDKSETEAISRHSEGSNNFIPKNLVTANTEEKSIQSYPSPEFLNSLSFIKKFYPAPLWGEGKFTKVTHEIVAISRHSERLAKESSLLQYKAVAKNENNLTETVFSRFTSHFLLPKAAFTLAEVLITLGIIGVVAAITMPVLLSNVNSKVKAERVLNIKQKLSKVTDKMAVQSGLMGYDSTDAFVKEMQKHMKIAKVCDNAHLDNC